MKKIIKISIGTRKESKAKHREQGLKISDRKRYSQNGNRVPFLEHGYPDELHDKNGSILNPWFFDFDEMRTHKVRTGRTLWLTENLLFPSSYGSALRQFEHATEAFGTAPLPLEPIDVPERIARMLHFLHTTMSIF